MSEKINYSVKPTPADMAEAQKIASAMIAAIPTDSSQQMILAALSLLLQSSFQLYVKREYRIGSFEDFAFHCRRNLVDAIRTDGHKP